jgi:hypothetical protein
MRDEGASVSTGPKCRRRPDDAHDRGRGCGAWKKEILWGIGSARPFKKVAISPASEPLTED